MVKRSVARHPASWSDDIRKGDGSDGMRKAAVGVGTVGDFGEGYVQHHCWTYRWTSTRKRVNISSFLTAPK